VPDTLAGVTLPLFATSLFFCSESAIPSFLGILSFPPPLEPRALFFWVTSTHISSHYIRPRSYFPASQFLGACRSPRGLFYIFPDSVCAWVCSATHFSPLLPRVFGRHFYRNIAPVGFFFFFPRLVFFNPRLLVGRSRTVIPFFS